MREPNPEKLNALVGKLVGDLGMSLGGASILLGDRLGSTRRWPTACRLPRRNWRKRPVCMNATCVNGCPARRLPDISIITPKKMPSHCPPNKPWRSPKKARRRFSPVHSTSCNPPTSTSPRSPKLFAPGKALAGTSIRSAFSRARSASSGPATTPIWFRTGFPALEGVEAKLKAGAKVADVGCGHGASTIVMAKAYPKFGVLRLRLSRAFDRAGQGFGGEAGIGDRITFAEANAKDFPAKGYDLVAFFDCLHDMGDPVGAGKHVKETLAKDGVWMIVEPFAHDNLKDNLNPVGRIFYSASTFICTPASLSQEVALGAWRPGGGGPVAPGRD